MLSGVISRAVSRRFSTEAFRVDLPDLKYGYSALEPVLSSKLLEVHHKKHHRTYVTNLNSALEQFEGKNENMKMQKLTLTTTEWLPFVKQSSSTLEDILTIQSIGKILHQLDREEESTLQMSRLSLRKSRVSSDPMRF